MKDAVPLKKYVIIAGVVSFIWVSSSLSVTGMIYPREKNCLSSFVSSGELTVYFIDVGQGDSILLQTPEKNFVLIDTGYEEYAAKVIRFLQNLSVTTLTAFIGTHPHADHIGGCMEIFNAFDVLSIYHPGYPYGSESYQRFLTAAENEGCPVYTDDDVDPGDTINISNSVSCRILHINKFASNANDASIVLRVDFNQVSFLFTGDINGDQYDQVETYLVDTWDVNIDILKVAHHGSQHSSTDYFLDEATPAISVISCGMDNPYGHPHEETLKRLSEHDSVCYRTDRNGTVTVKTNGITWTVMYEKPNHPPSSPVIVGPPSGKVKEEYEYRFHAFDPNADKVYYYIDWGDDIVDEWIGPYDSGEEITVKHTWMEKRTYTIKVKAMDTNGAESNWSHFEISMPENHQLSFRPRLSLFHQLRRIFIHCGGRQ